jgi:hypothetical protein
MNNEFYRYESIEYATIGVDGEYTTSSIPNPKINLITLNLFRETPKGYWIGYGDLNGFHSSQKWVSKTARKRYAYPTKEEALNNFIKRNEKRIKILSRQVSVCQIVVEEAKQILSKQ